MTQQHNVNLYIYIRGNHFIGLLYMYSYYDLHILAMRIFLRNIAMIYNCDQCESYLLACSVTNTTNVNLYSYMHITLHS